MTHFYQSDFTMTMKERMKKLNMPQYLVVIYAASAIIAGGTMFVRGGKKK